jgi:hypothetical protein
MALRGIGCEFGRWMELDQYRMKRRSLDQQY